MADNDVPQEPTVEPDAIRESADQWDTPQPPAPGSGDDRPTEQPDAIYESASEWDTPDKPGGNVEDKVGNEGDEQA